MTTAEAESARLALRRRTLSLTPLQLRQVRNLLADDLARSRRTQERRALATGISLADTDHVAALTDLLAVFDEAAAQPRRCEAQVDGQRGSVVLCAVEAVAGEPFCAEHRDRGWR